MTEPIVQDKKKAIIDRYGISGSMSQKLDLLQNNKIVVIADDSSSMKERTEHGTRWDELKQHVQVVIDITNGINNYGVDIYLLNGSDRPFQNVTNYNQISDHFNNNRIPNGVTPLTRVFERVLNDNKNVVNNNLLILIMTDGEPSNDVGVSNAETISKFKKVFKHKPKNVYVNVLACTTNDATMAYLSKWDEEIDNFDVTDDFESERDKITSIHGKIEFTYGTYVLKSMVGAMDATLDDLNETPKCKDKGCVIC